MIRPVLVEVGIFLIPFVLYALFLLATQNGLLVLTSWPLPVMIKLVVAAVLLMIASFVLVANFSGAPPVSTYVPAHIENGRLVPGVEK